MPTTAPIADPRTPTDGTLAQVVAQLAAEVSGPLTQALHRVVNAANSGHIDGSALSALRSEIDGARRAGLLGQQIARFAHGQARPGIEQVDLAALLREVLTQLAAAARTGTPGHRHAIQPVQVMGDASLLHTLVDAAASWAQAQAVGTIAWQLDAAGTRPWARLACRFTRRPGRAYDGPDGDGLDTLDWLLLRYAAHVAGATVGRTLQADQLELVLQLPHRVSTAEADMSAVELDAGPSTLTLLTGCQLLVLAARREPRQQVRDALRGHEVFIDYVHSVAAAEAYCDDGSPRVLVYDAAFDGAALHGLQARLAAMSPPVAMIELLPSGHGCAIGEGVIRLGADDLAQTLPSVLLMELARQA